ncbi:MULTISPECIES: ATP-binding protein [Paenibacillus]|uniref:ATP-binding protein n=1 Tax=Paenibacillus TaxID=44249 RepID=UPI000FD6A10C
MPFTFERFYRVNRSRSRQTGASDSGLDLAIAKAIVNLHHGTLQMNCDRNCGTEVIIS